eukprot:TRINITY_DN5642_c0_g1_i1.p1 TRINITY_DN5642_c0_g1~~TRINITY_DN5642_c0_g1_i1.p1  ORF type:complete len:399 (+),score=70.13 TRINITY_DN5642_c0_g1_i1:78-1274(+)
MAFSLSTCDANQNPSTQPQVDGPCSKALSLLRKQSGQPESGLGSMASTPQGSVNPSSRPKRSSSPAANGPLLKASKADETSELKLDEDDTLPELVHASFDSENVDAPNEHAASAGLQPNAKHFTSLKKIVGKPIDFLPLADEDAWQLYPSDPLTPPVLIGCNNPLSSAEEFFTVYKPTIRGTVPKFHRFPQRLKGPNCAILPDYLTEPARQRPGVWVRCNHLIGGSPVIGNETPPDGWQAVEMRIKKDDRFCFAHSLANLDVLPPDVQRDVIAMHDDDGLINLGIARTVLNDDLTYKYMVCNIKSGLELQADTKYLAYQRHSGNHIVGIDNFAGRYIVYDSARAHGLKLDRPVTRSDLQQLMGWSSTVILQVKQKPRRRGMLEKYRYYFKKAQAQPKQ